MKCPACQHEQIENFETCPKCNVIVKKYLEKLDERRELEKAKKEKLEEEQRKQALSDQQKALKAQKEQYPFICSDCGTRGKPVSTTKGSTGVELLLWLTFLFPGIIYSVWRLSTRYNACPVCKGAHMIPFDSPRGKQLLEQYPGQW